MSLINEVKKTLCRTAIEMDADDIAHHLAQQRQPRKASRTQVSHALQALVTGDQDIIRTRPGLYQHRPNGRPEQPLLPDAGPALPTVLAPVWGNPVGVAVAVRAVQSTSEQPIHIVADSAFVCAQLATRLGARTAPVDLKTLTDCILHFASSHLGRPCHLSWRAGATATAAEATRQQCAGRHIVVIASPQVVDEATQTASALRSPLRVWTIGSTPGEPEPSLHPDIIESRPLRPEDLPLPRPSHEPRTTGSSRVAQDGDEAPCPPPPSVPTRASRAQVGAGLDSLWQLDDTAYRRPVDGITGRGNTHALKRQALRLGRTYAQRWCATVTDDIRERLLTMKDGHWLPSRLYPDILGFAEFHGLHVHGSRLIKELLRCGFWQHLRDAGEDRHSERAA